MCDHLSDPFHILNKDNFVCRALDNRIGGFMITEVARLLAKTKRNYLLAYVPTLFEVGLSEMITETIKPNVAIVTDVTHDITPMINQRNKDIVS